MRLWAMAWRNVWRNRRRTLVTMGAMTFGLFAMILYAGLVEGYLLQLERNVLDLEMGDVQITRPPFARSRRCTRRSRTTSGSWGSSMMPGIRRRHGLLGPALAAAGEASAGVSLRGLNPDRDAAVSEIYDHVREWAVARPGRRSRRGDRQEARPDPRRRRRRRAHPPIPRRRWVDGQRRVHRARAAAERGRRRRPCRHLHARHRVPGAHGPRPRVAPDHRASARGRAVASSGDPRTRGGRRGRRGANMEEARADDGGACSRAPAARCWRCTGSSTSASGC